MLPLDEPFASLDAITRTDMQAWLADALAAEPRTVILVTHDVEEALFLSDRVAVMSRRPGRVVEELEVGLPAPAGPARRRDGPPAHPAARPRAGGVGDEASAACDLLLAGFVGVWAWIASLDSVDDLLVASPGETVQALGDDCALLIDNALVTLYEVLLGLAMAIAMGLLFAVAMHLNRTLREAAYPLLVASQAIPIVVLAPIFVLAFDYGIGPKIAIVALICFFPITVNVLDGLRSVDPGHL